MEKLRVAWNFEMVGYEYWESGRLCGGSGGMTAAAEPAGGKEALRPFWVALLQSKVSWESYKDEASSPKIWDFFLFFYIFCFQLFVF